MALNLTKLNPHSYPLSPEAQANQARLLSAMLELEQGFGRELVVNSGVRSHADHERIYAEINERRRSLGIRELTVPQHSNHLVEIAAAVDIADTNRKFWDYCMANLDTLERLGVYLEIRLGGWTHCQVVPPKSGTRIFHP